ncbi:Na+/H+ antiporter subunit D [Streptomyces spinoverrucosus]|uniref:Na+/H+ antiporter subunit D n=1 Tax=Streptomyces spinoverrucosus TaxID=284043 RepID=A0A4Y3V8C4_9ACTN|nr:Na+/H+ antiporter subunit D [Streptomyces spinoverrucosus]GEC02675.1 Na+/H+ antiporter subunit D [Streptomyces spinoverrucosus]GHB41320.1 Na+/H+ antiporter subunit D [Streptomyces spinoverrucosus]
MTAALLALPVLLPVLGLGVSLLGLPRALVRGLSSIVLAVVLADGVALLALADTRGPLALHIGGWPAPLGITLVADRLSALLLTVSVLVALAVLVFAIGQGTAEERRRSAEVFHPAYLVLVTGVSLAFLSGDLFNLFVAFEMMLAASYVLITLDADGDRTRAGMTYMITSLTSSLLFLTLVALVYAAAGTVTLAQLGPRLAELPDGIRSALALLLLAVLGIKAAIVPLHFWLPDSYPTAPAPITAVFAALLTKVGVYALLRTQTLLFPRTGVWTVLACAAIAAMIVGILGAIAQDDLNRLLSFTLVSHIGFMLFGLALFDTLGLTGTILYVIHHIVVQAALFLVAGLAVRRTGTAALHRMAHGPPPGTLVAVLFGLPALSLSGMPPFSGFVAKLTLLRAGVAHGGPTAYALAAAALLTSLLTLYTMTRVWTSAFADRPSRPAGGAAALPQRRAAETTGGVRGTGLMLAATAGLTVTGLAIAMCAGLLAGVGERAAQDLLDPGPYRSVVLDGEER